MIVKGNFKRERVCRHTIRYTPIDKAAEKIGVVFYIKNETLEALTNPNEITITIEAKS